MKAVILAGGLGTRLSEETSMRPKPMVEIGGKPILWHIMKIYSCFDVNDFIICCGYKSYMIKEFFANYFLHTSDMTFDLENNKMHVHQNNAEPWKVTLVDTGEKTLTGGRLKRVKDYIGNETFCLTYGDGVADVNIHLLVEFHKKNNRLATVTGAQPPGRFGALGLEPGQNTISTFLEKPKGDSAWINGGFFVLEPKVLDYIAGDMTSWEEEPLKNLAKDGMLAAYRHYGFWQCMDTLSDKMKLEKLWESGKAPWRMWNE